MKKLPILEHIEIIGIAAEGKALARVNDCVVFVPYCVPGDIVDLQVTKKKHNFMEARVLQFHKLSEKRCEPVCPHYGECGGCKWQILPYPEQLKAKQQQIIDNLVRIGHLELLEVSPILGSREQYGYRNKLEFTCAAERWVSWEEVRAAGGLENIQRDHGIGFHITQQFDKVLDIQCCKLMPELNNEIRNFIREYAQQHDISFYKLDKVKRGEPWTGRGLLRNVMLRNNHKGEYMVVVIFSGEAVNNDKATALLQALHDRFPQIISLQYVINAKSNDTIQDLPVHLYFGIDHIMEEMEGLQFKVRPKSFYQTNTEQAYELYKVARQAAQLTGKELVYDLYTGTGTIANFVARQAAQVIGIEYVEDAIEDARENAKANDLSNTLFFAGDMKDILTTDFINQYGRPDVIITDPPRAGMHEDVIKTIRFAAPQRIVYVSCNPATQARDLAMLTDMYQITQVQPVDMFPQTQHVENVVTLEKL